MKSLFVVVALLVSASAMANGQGNGTAGSPGAGDAGQGYGGAGPSLGYFPGWQTASPARRDALIAQQPRQAPAARETLRFPSWVRQ